MKVQPKVRYSYLYMKNTLISRIVEEKVQTYVWNIEDLPPKLDDEPWFTSQLSGTCNLTKLLVHPQSTSYCQWVSEGSKIPRWNAPTKWSPYDFRILLGRFLPDLFRIYWHPQIRKVVQLDVHAIKNNRFAYRELNLVELRQYILNQMHRIQFLLKPNKESVIYRVFNNSRFTSSEAYPLYISLHDDENLLTKLVVEGGHICFGRSVIYQNKFPQILHVQYKLTHTAPAQPDPIIAYLEKFIGKEMENYTLFLINSIAKLVVGRPSSLACQLSHRKASLLS